MGENTKIKEIPDLWPDTINSGLVENSFIIDVLKKQASLLKGKTNGLVEAEVECHIKEDKVICGFYLFSDKIKNHRSSLFFAEYKLEKQEGYLPDYPVSFTLPYSPSSYESCHEAEDYEHLKQILKEILRHNRTKSIIKSLMAHASYFNSDKNNEKDL